MNTVLAKNLRRILALSSAALILTLVACSPAEPGSNTADGGVTNSVLPVEPGNGIGGDLELTLEDLAEYNGKDNLPAYIAVGGIIYDVTDAEGWEDGEHQGYMAGEDLTDELDNDSPHDRSILDGIPQVGTLID